MTENRNIAPSRPIAHNPDNLPFWVKRGPFCPSEHIYFHYFSCRQYRIYVLHSQDMENSIGVLKLTHKTQQQCVQKSKRCATFSRPRSTCRSNCLSARLQKSTFLRKNFLGFYRAMHYSAKRGLAIACHLSVSLSVCLCQGLSSLSHSQKWRISSAHISWNSLKIISRLVSVGRSLSTDPNIMDLL